jgi:dipeptidyl aminopeptidase/acylaminoacyl peptidase
MQQKHLILLLIWLCAFQAKAQSTLSVESIMCDPIWMGTFPSQVSWSDDGKQLFFQYNREEDPADSLYKINLSFPNQIQKVKWAEAKNLQKSAANYNRDRSLRIYRDGTSLMLDNLQTGNKSLLLDWFEEVSNPRFLANEQEISFVSGGNIFVFNRESKSITKLTRMTNAKKKATSDKDGKPSFLESENLALLHEVNAREEASKQSKDYRESIGLADKESFTYYSEGKNYNNLQISPDKNFASFAIYTPPTGSKNTKVPDYTAASGYTEDLISRSKVGTPPTKTEIGIYDIQRDTVYFVNPSNLPGIQDLPDYLKDYPNRVLEKKDRDLVLSNLIFSPDGKRALIQIRAYDNKDRWIAEVNLQNGTVKVLERQRDEAWVGGPGVGGSYGGGILGWLPDSQHIYFQSEETGYSHLYLLNLTSGEKKALTTGKFEVFDPFISKDTKYWYFTSSEVDPGERHFYRMPLMGGKLEKLTSMTGNNEVVLSPDEKKLAILYSYSNIPTELFIQEAKVGAQSLQLTSGQSAKFKAYSWKDPQIVRFTAEDGAQVPARLYLPEPAKKNGAAVIFVHGAGYLQNVHKWWSSYFREYMFHNLLTDLGYTVLDIDYRGSAGYGRDWRTGIYRHMGGKDLSDQVDGAKFLIETHGVDAERIGIYGGSYGGFITLMGLFTAPEVFKSGAALRSVTDWAHYNHGYTANILNTPEEDPIAYRRSSPIYFAEGLQGNLLIAHGMIDVNVHFQDVVRLSQRLIELEKDNWEMAIYPVEDHGFLEPSSWTDEYKRILKLFNSTLLIPKP